MVSWVWWGRRNREDAGCPFRKELRIDDRASVSARFAETREALEGWGAMLFRAGSSRRAHAGKGRLVANCKAPSPGNYQYAQNEVV